MQPWRPWPLPFLWMWAIPRALVSGCRRIWNVDTTLAINHWSLFKNSHPPIAKITRVSQGMAPTVSLHLVAAKQSKLNFVTRFKTIKSTQLFKCDWHLHCRRVDECEEQDIGADLLVGMQSGLPVVVIRGKPDDNFLQTIIIVFFYGLPRLRVIRE